MITIDKIKEYIKCPQFGDLDYGKWGALRLEQREAYKHLIDIVEGLEQEIESLKAIIEEVRKYIKSNEEEYGSLEDNEKIILGILERVNKK